MPRTLTTDPRNLYPPTARHYHSDLSIWLSVDPMSDKYPGVSPYTYCGDNPVRLVDEDGRTWETPEDNELADNLIQQAQTNIHQNERRIANLSSNKFKVFLYKNEISSLKRENEYLYEGIANITNMTNDASTIYHFEYISSGDGEVFKTTNGTQNIRYRNYAMAWHETVHIGDARNNPSIWGFDNNSCLGTTEENLYKSEVRAYSSQYSFDHSSMRSANGSIINSIDDVRVWININTIYRPLKRQP